jgi:hypothetical protein
VRGPGSVLEQLALDGGEERLGQGIVPALAGAPDRQTDPQLVCGGGELGRGVL